MTYPQIPMEIRRELDSLRVSAAEAFQREDWETAVRRLEETELFLLRQQERYGRRFHKGWELHNAGIALLRLQRFGDGATKIFLAYGEDALSTETGDEDTIDGSPAGLTLKSLKVREDLLEAMKMAARRHKQAGTVPFITEELLEEVLSAASTTVEQAQAPVVEHARERESRSKRTIASLIGPKERRCFVGGNYFLGGPNLMDIKRIVIHEGFDAILADDFESDDSDVHEHSMLLLHHCSKAVFEVTCPVGELMEIERCRDYSIRPLLLRQTLPDRYPTVSEMITAMEVAPYSLVAELEPLIHEYLHA